MSSKDTRSPGFPVRDQHGHTITDYLNPPWGPVPEILFDRNTEDIPAPSPYRLVKGAIRRVDDGSRRVVLPSESAVRISRDSMARDADNDEKRRFGTDHWEKQTRRMDSMNITDAYTAKNECLRQQKLVATNRLKVRRLRASMREKKEEEANLRDSIGRHLSNIACCTCGTSAQLIEKDHKALQSMAQSYLDLEYIHDQAEDELEEQEQELSRSAARLSYLFHLGANTDPLEGIRPKREARRSKGDLQGPNPSPASLAKSETSGTLSQSQPRISKSQLQGPIVFGTDKHHDPIPQIGEGVTTTGPSDFPPTWGGAETNSCGELPSLDQTLLDILGPSSDKTQPLGRMSRAELDSAKDPLKLAPDERFSPFDLGDSGESGPSQQRGRFINNWMLHQLRNSSLESARLRSHPEWQTMRDQGWDDTDISRLALERWHSDDTGTVASGERTIIPSQRSEGAGTAIWRGTGRPSYGRKRTRSVAFAPVPPLHRTSRHETAWDEFYPEGQSSSQEAKRPSQGK
ncbi:hypothetical protein BO78DRAFT_395643 [Aspergillus sclerotiicarbonarius CBS 121057]|uniref:Uncharacterized protein n=1 Tax=Aspergillus sclerotiicarbonarius (strain CBS 121057 / IBT 28362) TaxID=1448318 RepID=A0A319F0I8_ASPSB|nr:hypothetical protein BO78DRAFT_395643 [Aspergillus sclerotiicarbonarius CBS 121057]